ncbi:MAG: DUF2283 domain-containing protein [Dehalococcoidia bacterium]
MALGQVDYDKEADVLHVQLVPREQVARTHALDDMRLIDYSADGAVLGVEFIDASAGIDLRDVPFARKVEKLIGDAGLGLRLFV